MPHTKGYTQNLLTCCKMRLGKKDPKVSQTILRKRPFLSLAAQTVWETLWCLGHHCPGACSRGWRAQGGEERSAQGWSHTRFLTAPNVGHSWAPQLRWGQTPWEYLWGMDLRWHKTTAQQWEVRGGSVRNSKWEKEGEEEPLQPIVGTIIMQVPLQPWEVPMLEEKRVRNKEWWVSAVTNWPQTGLPISLHCSVGSTKRAGNKGVNLRGTRVEGVLGFVLVSHHTSLFQSAIN